MASSKGLEFVIRSRLRFDRPLADALKPDHLKKGVSSALFERVLTSYGVQFVSRRDGTRAWEGSHGTVKDGTSGEIPWWLQRFEQQYVSVLHDSRFGTERSEVPILSPRPFFSSISSTDGDRERSPFFVCGRIVADSIAVRRTPPLQPPVSPNPYRECSSQNWRKSADSGCCEVKDGIMPKLPIERRAIEASYELAKDV